MKAVEAVRSQHGLSKSLETVGQKQNVRRHVKVVVFFECRHFTSRPYVLGVSIVPGTDVIERRRAFRVHAFRVFLSKFL